MWKMSVAVTLLLSVMFAQLHSSVLTLGVPATCDDDHDSTSVSSASSSARHLRLILNILCDAIKEKVNRLGRGDLQQGDLGPHTHALQTEM